MACSEDFQVIEQCGTGVHVFNSEDSECCECRAMKADGTYRYCEDMHNENRCPGDCHLTWRVRNETREGTDGENERTD